MSIVRIHCGLCWIWVFVWRRTDLPSGFNRMEKWEIGWACTAQLGNTVNGRISAHSANILRGISMGSMSIGLGLSNCKVIAIACLGGLVLELYLEDQDKLSL